MAHVEDRWTRPSLKAKGPRRLQTSDYGRGTRFRAVWTDGEGVRRRRSFDTRAGAELFLLQIADLARLQLAERQNRQGSPLATASTAELLAELARRQDAV